MFVRPTSRPPNLGKSGKGGTHPGSKAGKGGKGGTGAPVRGLTTSAFKVTAGLTTIGVFMEVSGLSVEHEVLDYMEGGSNSFIHKLPGRRKYPNLVLKAGITNQTALYDWFAKTADQPELRQVTIDLLDPRAQVQRTWAFADAYPIKWTGPTLAAKSNEIGQETVELVHRGMTLASGGGG